MNDASVTYIEVVMLEGTDPHEHAMRIAKALRQTCNVALVDFSASLDRLMFWDHLIGYVFDAAEEVVGRQGREAIVHCQRAALNHNNNHAARVVGDDERGTLQ